MKRLVWLLVAMMMAGCFADDFTVVDEQDAGEAKQALVKPASVSFSTTLDPVQNSPDIVRNAGWSHVPNLPLSALLSDGSSGNANFTYVEADAPSAVGHEELEFTAPSAFFCDLLSSAHVTSVRAIYKIHTAQANEFPFWRFHPPTGGGVDISCGTQSPWRPVGTVMTCSSSTNPNTGVAWTKADVGCPGSSFLIAGYTLGVSAHFVFESMQLQISASN